MGRTREQFGIDILNVSSQISFPTINSEKTYRDNKEKLIEQAQKLLEGPKSTDKDVVLDWISDTADAIGFFDSENFEKILKIDKHENRIRNLREKTGDIRYLIKNWIQLFNEYENREILLNKDGTLKDLTGSTLQNDRILRNVKNYLDLQLSDIQKLIPPEIETNEKSPEKDVRVPLNSGENAGNVSVNPKQTGNSEKLIPDAVKEAHNTEQAGPDVPKKDTQTASQVQPDNKVLTEVEKANLRIDQFNDRMEEERNAFKQWAVRLKAIGKHDSDEYKDLIKTLEDVSTKIKKYKPEQTDAAANFNAMDDNQIQAIKYAKVYVRISQYLDHKARRGVNRNAYEKLAAVEELNRRVSQVIRDLNPRPFSFKMDGKRCDFNPSVIGVTYDDRMQLPAYKDKYLDTSTSPAVWEDNIRKSQKTVTGADHAKIAYAMDCMDRIMLKVQINNKKAFEGKTLNERDQLLKTKYLKDFISVKDSFSKDPIVTPVKNHPAPERTL